MKKIILKSILVVGMVCFANNAYANTVNFIFENVFAKYNDIGSLQLDFAPTPGIDFPSVWDVTITAGSAIAYDSKSQYGAYVDSSLDDSGEHATGFFAMQDFSDKPFHDGLIFSATSPVDILVDLDTVQIFNFTNTSEPIEGINLSQEILQNGDRNITASAVPIPGAVWLLGSGLAGLVATRRKKKNS